MDKLSQADLAKRAKGALRQKRWRFAHPDQVRAARRKDYAEHAERYRAKSKALGNPSHYRRREFLNWLKEGLTCMDCRRAWPIFVLEFDHRPGTEKIFNIGNWASKSYTLDELQAELQKCDLVCSNCHRIRTYGIRRVVQ